MDIAVNQEFAQLQGGQAGQQRHVLADTRQHVVDRGIEVGELGFEQRLIGRFDVVALDKLDDFVALVHCLLDQGIATQSTNDVEPRNVGFVFGA